MAPVRQRVHPLLVIAALGLLAGCGADDEPAPDLADVRAAQHQAPSRLYWAGTTIAGLPLTGLTQDGGRTGFLYGTCKPSGDSGCGLPVDIQTSSICDSNALVLDVRPSSSRRARGIVVRGYDDGTLELATGDSTVRIFTNGSVRPQDVLAALRPVGGTGTARDRLPPARYPRDYVLELRRVSDAYRRLRSVRAVRGELGISKRAVRFRLALAGELGTSRLRRPAAEFAGSPCAVEPAGEL